MRSQSETIRVSSVIIYSIISYNSLHVSHIKSISGLFFEMNNVINLDHIEINQKKSKDLQKKVPRRQLIVRHTGQRTEASILFMNWHFLMCLTSGHAFISDVTAAALPGTGDGKHLTLGWMKVSAQNALNSLWLCDSVTLLVLI